MGFGGVAVCVCVGGGAGQEEVDPLDAFMSEEVGRGGGGRKWDGCMLCGLLLKRGRGPKEGSRCQSWYMIKRRFAGLCLGGRGGGDWWQQQDWKRWTH